jgi:hypothetical protein
VFDHRSPGTFRVQHGHWIALPVGSLCCVRLGVPVKLIGDPWIGVSGDMLITSRCVGSLDELALLELRAGAEEGDQMCHVDRSPAGPGGLDQLERQRLVEVIGDLSDLVQLTPGWPVVRSA